MNPVAIRRLPTGVPGFDEALGGGVPELSFNLIAGSAGCGKTTLGHQILFANAGPERKALYISVIGEPPVKMLRYQQQFSFFDPAKVSDGSIEFLYLGEQALEGDLDQLLQSITDKVDQMSPALVVVDSFRGVVQRTVAGGAAGVLQLQDFTQRLAQHLTTCQATTFLLGEYAEGESDSAIFTVADGIIWLYQAVERNSVVRKLQVVKMRGQGQIAGLHTARISDQGFSVFPRLLQPVEPPRDEHRPDRRLKTGVPGLDEMLGGGVPEGYSVLVAGPSGSGKSVLANQFIVEGVRAGEPGILAVFEKRPADGLHTTPRGEELARMARERKLEMIHLRPLDLSIDETLVMLRDAALRIGAKRAVIDSLSGLELALAPTFRDGFRESLYRMMATLTGMGVTVMATVELADCYTELRFSPHGIAFLTDAIVIQRYVEIDARLRRVISVVKVRDSAHSTELREYQVSSTEGLVVGQVLHGHRGILTGSADPRRDEP